ncbi:MAG: glycoside hydrolase family 88 protein [Chloroflexota bacterium]
MFENIDQAKTMPIVGEALTQAIMTIQSTVPRMGRNRPSIGRADGSYEHCHATHWVDGFWSGQLWLAYAATDNTFFLDAARQQRPYFIDRLNRSTTLDHDTGFLYSLSVVADYIMTGDQTARDLGLQAATVLAKRFNPAGQFIRAWNDWDGESEHFRQRKRGKIIIDCMENLALLFWAARETNNLRLSDIATAHAMTTMHYIVRADGSTYHTYEFDPTTGTPQGGFTFQGYADESCWSRGQSWAIHGFAQTYQYTHEPLFLEVAQRTADYAISHLPEDGVAYWDYNLPPDAPHYRDSSAAAIMAAGLLLLADNLEEQIKVDHYRAVALHILHSLTQKYTTAHLPYTEGLLLHGAAYVQEGQTDSMLAWGDYFYMEALMRVHGHRQFFW